MTQLNGPDDKEYTKLIVSIGTSCLNKIGDNSFQSSMMLP
jgi:hypothetical protein